MKIKVCGLTKYEHMVQLCNPQEMGAMIDFIGVNFYTNSPRFYKGSSLEQLDKKNTKVVGIFVNAEADVVRALIDKHQLDYVQLHGDESPSYCTLLGKDTKVIKAFSHYKIQDVNLLKKYEMCAFYIFDRATTEYGGSGKKFDWQLLEEYSGTIPYLLAGGISINDVEALKAINHHKGFMGIDINSKFELKPGIKDVASIKQFLQLITNEQ